jgi:protoporphyrinogen oxidase
MLSETRSNLPVVILGGGPAGLTAAYELTEHGFRPAVIEKRDRVGGLARTEQYKGYYFDMGGHRFFTKSEEVRKLWFTVLEHEFLRRPRLSRIYYKSKFFNYPLKPFNALMGLGIWESILIFCSYLKWQIWPHRQEETFEQWVTNRFGQRLFLTFFKTYTEKVWGISCSELKAEWAAQRIKDLSLKTALLSMFWKPKTTIKTLIEEFDYPRHGPGMMWGAFKDLIETRGGTVQLNTDVVAIHRTGMRLDHVTIARDGRTETVEGSHFLSSMPVTEFIKKLDPPAPVAVLEAAAKLHYRDFLTVCLILNKADTFPDNWIYIHDPQVKVGRIQNFKNWSPDMVADQGKTSLGLEYFCTEGDDLWTMSDADLVALGKKELERIGLARAADVEDGCVFRVPKAYPVYDSAYRTHLDVIREFVGGLENFQTIGRNGLHRYNNQDHAMLTGLLAVRNLVLGQDNDLWNVNADQEYHEEIREENKPSSTPGTPPQTNGQHPANGQASVSDGAASKSKVIMQT